MMNPTTITGGWPEGGGEVQGRPRASTKISTFSTNAQSRFASVVLGSVQGQLCHILRCPWFYVVTQCTKQVKGPWRTPWQLKTPSRQINYFYSSGHLLFLDMDMCSCVVRVQEWKVLAMACLWQLDGPWICRDGAESTLLSPKCPHGFGYVS